MNNIINIQLRIKISSLLSLLLLYPELELSQKEICKWKWKCKCGYSYIFIYSYCNCDMHIKQHCPYYSTSWALSTYAVYAIMHIQTYLCIHHLNTRHRSAPIRHTPRVFSLCLCNTPCIHWRAASPRAHTILDRRVRASSSRSTCSSSSHRRRGIQPSPSLGL